MARPFVDGRLEPGRRVRRRVLRVGARSGRRTAPGAPYAAGGANGLGARRGGGAAGGGTPGGGRRATPAAGPGGAGGGRRGGPHGSARPAARPDGRRRGRRRRGGIGAAGGGAPGGARAGRRRGVERRRVRARAAPRCRCRSERRTGCSGCCCSRSSGTPSRPAYGRAGSRRAPGGARAFGRASSHRVRSPRVRRRRLMTGVGGAASARSRSAGCATPGYNPSRHPVRARHGGRDARSRRSASPTA